MSDSPVLERFRLGRFDNHGVTRARYQGHWIEVEHGIPGEVVEAEINGRKRLRGRILDLLEASPDRVVPPCQYFREWYCGGCQWQHLSYHSQVQRKAEGVEADMRRQGLPFTVTSVHAMEDPWRYRTTAGISLGRSAGFRRHASLAIVPIRDCPISHPLIGQLMNDLNERLEAGSLPNFRGRLRLEVRTVRAKGEDHLLVLVRPDREQPPEQADVDTVVECLGSLSYVEGVALEQTDGSVEVVRGPLVAPVEVGGREVLASAASFFQTNLRLLPRLIDRLAQEIRPVEGKRVADVYGGVGIFGLFLAAEGATVAVIESNPMAVEAGRETAASWGLSGPEFLTTTAEEALSGEAQYDVVIVDPPRSGLSEPVVAALLARKPPLVLYVSCLGSSLARDLSVLVPGGYGVEHLELFDFYPQTYHVEVVAVLHARA